MISYHGLITPHNNTEVKNKRTEVDNDTMRNEYVNVGHTE